MNSKTILLQLLSTINAFDDIEVAHLDDAIAWIKSGRSLYRTIKPNTPNKHLVSYFVVIDEIQQKILLTEHKRAQLWLPAGGHVEPNEHPTETVKRECLEELNLEAEFKYLNPIFITLNDVGHDNHLHFDVNLWYVLKGVADTQYQFDDREFHSIKWFNFDEIPFLKADPHLSRFINKYLTLL